MAYVSNWLEPAMKKHPYSSLFFSNIQLFQLFQQMTRDCNNKYIKLPIDQSNFDWQQSKSMLRIFFSCIKKFIAKEASDRVKKDLLLVTNSIEISLLDIPG